MCGIAGFFDERGTDSSFANDMGKYMIGALAHRGPDETNVWFDHKKGIILAHSRLSIIDRSSAGSQPMKSGCGRYTIVFNGEIYNHQKLRESIPTNRVYSKWRGRSDTETLLELIVADGLEVALKKLVGMFAFALWDSKHNKLFLARDRIGEKPVYYGKQGSIIFFGSELKSLRRHPEFKAEVNRDALRLFFRHNYIPAPYSIYKDIYKLPPGHYIELTENAEPKPFWQIAEHSLGGNDYSFQGDHEYLHSLENSLINAVKMQVNADVPVGAFLSGGVDSSLIVALMQEVCDKPVKTFSIGFEERSFNEAAFAREVATYLGTDHYEKYISQKDVIDIIPNLGRVYDEPFADSSQIPSYLVSSMAKEHVTVSLTGDGADELFCGYERYFRTEFLFNTLSYFPGPLLSFAGTGFDVARIQMEKVLDSVCNNSNLNLNNFRNYAHRMDRFSQLLKCLSREELYLTINSHHQKLENLVLRTEASEKLETYSSNIFETLPFLEQMMITDLLGYLPDNILVKTDRATMANSLEARTPFLDHRVVETALALPKHLKYKNGSGKICLKELLSRRIPRRITDRPKMGFGVPIGSWLRGPLRDWAEYHLEYGRISEGGYLDADAVSRMWKEHLSGVNYWQYQLWNIIMFELWRENSKL